jgi:hypothetical protein
MKLLAISFAGLALQMMPAAGQTGICGPRKPVNQVGGPKAVTNPVISLPRAPQAPVSAKPAARSGSASFVRIFD